MERNSYHGRHHRNNENPENRVQRFSEETTLHGLRKACTEASPLKKVIWVVIILGMLSVYLYLVIGTIRKYFRYDTVTSVEKVWNDTLVFPRITICNVNTLSKSRVKSKFPKIYDYISTEEFPIRTENRTFSSDQHLKSTDNSYNISDLDRSLIEVFEKTLVPIDEMFLQCRWQNYVVPCDKYIQPFLTDLNYCYSVNTQKILEVIQPGPDFGMGLTIDIHQEEYLMTPASLGAGVFLLIHDHESYPVMKQRSLSLAPGFEHYLSIQREETLRMKKPYSRTDCIDGKGNYKGRKTNNSYSFEECLGRCALDTIYGPCNCIPYSKDPKLSCKISDLLSCGNYKTSSTLYDSQCDCLPACQEINYNVKATSLSFPSELGFNELQIRNISRKTMDGIRRNVLVLRIYFGGMEYIMVEQKPAITTGQLIADIGGQLGLFLGASLITVVEFVEFIAVTLWYCLTKRGKLKSPPDPTMT